MSFITSGVAVFSSTFPSPVTGFIASNPTETTVDLVWKRSSAATLYSIESSPPSGTMTTSDTFITFIELTDGTEYTFTITPSNANGNGSPTTSNPITTLVQVPVPEAVTNFVASNPTDTTVDLVWDPALYATEYAIETFPVSFTAYGLTDTFFTFYNLTPDTEYTFTITPVNISGNGPPTTSDPISTLLPFPGSAPYIDNTPVSVTTTTIELTWYYDVPSYATSYNVYCRDPVTYEVLYVQSCSLTPPYTFTGLQTNYAYVFNLASVNARGEQEEPTSGTDPIYTIPTLTGLSVSNPTTTTVDITWDLPITNSSVQYFTYFITSTPATTEQQASGTNSHTFTGLETNTEYTFTVTPQIAYNSLNGDPVTSDPITLFPLPDYGPAVYNTFTDVTSTTIGLSWFEYVPEYATSFNVYAYSVIDGLIGFVNVPISSFSYTYTGLQPNTEYYFAVAGVNVTGAGPEGAGSGNVFTLPL